MFRKTPYYSYDSALLKQTLSAVKDAAAHHFSGNVPAFVHYAVKANHNPEILKIIAGAGLGADCVSGGEIREAVEAGFKPSSIVYAGVGKTDAEIEYGLKTGIGCFNVESGEELEVISEIAGSLHLVARVALRINPNVRAHTHANITTGLSENKFGINLDMVPRVVDSALSLPGIELIGIHFHIGSQILDMSDFKALCGRINELQEWFVQRGVVLSIINVGGGLGVDYEHPEVNPVPDFDKYFSTFADNLRFRDSQQLHCELGRSIVAQCGSLISRCTYVKKGSLKKFVILDAGMNDLIRPALYEAYHKIDNLSDADGMTQVYDVVGPICESSDCFARGRMLPQVHRGDILAIRSSGAYGESMASTYNSHPLPDYEIR